MMSCHHAFEVVQQIHRLNWDFSQSNTKVSPRSGGAEWDNVQLTPAFQPSAPSLRLVSRWDASQCAANLIIDHDAVDIDVAWLIYGTTNSYTPWQKPKRQSEGLQEPCTEVVDTTTNKKKPNVSRRGSGPTFHGQDFPVRPLSLLRLQSCDSKLTNKCLASLVIDINNIHWVEMINVLIMSPPWEPSLGPDWTIMHVDLYTHCMHIYTDQSHH